MSLSQPTQPLGHLEFGVSIQGQRLLQSTTSLLQLLIQSDCQLQSVMHSTNFSSQVSTHFTPRSRSLKLNRVYLKYWNPSWTDRHRPRHESRLWQNRNLGHRLMHFEKLGQALESKSFDMCPPGRVSAQLNNIMHIWNMIFLTGTMD